MKIFPKWKCSRKQQSTLQAPVIEGLSLANFLDHGVAVVCSGAALSKLSLIWENA